MRRDRYQKVDDIRRLPVGRKLARYDENAVLWNYIWGRYGTRFLTDHERHVVYAAHASLKAQGSPVLPRQVFERAGGSEPNVSRDLELGFDAFRSRVTVRILAEHSHEIDINRCPQCDRVVRTPTAQQCFWCGHDWHES